VAIAGAAPGGESGGPDPPASTRGTCANRVNMVSFSPELVGGRVLLRTTDTAVVNDENRASDNNLRVESRFLSVCAGHIYCLS